MLFKEEKVYLIDWTCAGIDFPLNDLALISMFWSFTSDQDHQLLASYFLKSPDEKTTATLRMFKKHGLVKWAMWPIRKILADYPQVAQKLGPILAQKYTTPTKRSFDQYLASLFDGSFSKLMKNEDDWIDLHLSRVHKAMALSDKPD